MDKGTTSKGITTSRFTCFISNSFLHSQTALQNKISAIPKPDDMVLWSSLHEALFTPVSEGGWRKGK